MSKKILATQRSRMYRLFKESLKCCSCGYDRDTSVLEFHHIVPNNKLEEIPKLISIGEYDTIISELKKCAVVCSNCHNIIHNSTNAKVAMEVASSLKVVDTTYFENLCCTFNVLVNEEIESTMEDNTSSDNIEVLIVEDKLNKKKKMEILVNHLINNYDGVATDKFTEKSAQLNKERADNKKKELQNFAQFLVQNYDGCATDQLNISEIERAYGKSRRTINRYIAELQQADIINGHVDASLIAQM